MIGHDSVEDLQHWRQVGDRSGAGSILVLGTVTVPGTSESSRSSSAENAAAGVVWVTKSFGNKRPDDCPRQLSEAAVEVKSAPEVDLAGPDSVIFFSTLKHILTFFLTFGVTSVAVGEINARRQTLCWDD